MCIDTTPTGMAAEVAGLFFGKDVIVEF